MRHALQFSFGLFLLSGLHAVAQIQVGTYFPATIDTPRDYPGAAAAGASERQWSYTIRHAGATYIAVHFVDFDLGPGDELIVEDTAGGQRYSMTGRGKMQAGTFWAQHVKGDAARMRLIVGGSEGGRGFAIDQYAAGNVDLDSLPMPESVSGPDDRQNAICYAQSHPVHYHRGRAVARLLTNGSAFCTGSLVGPGNHLLTNNHCISSATKAVNTDFDFMAEAPQCNTPNCPDCFGGMVFSGSRLIRNHGTLDYALVQLAEGDPASSFGFLEFDNRSPIVGEAIYIPQHPRGRAKEFAIYSTHPEDTGGLARINRFTPPSCIGGEHQDVGYFADTEPGSSGSPILAVSSHKLLALHHCAGSPNTGVPINLIYPSIQADLSYLSTYGRVAPGAMTVMADTTVSGQEADRAADFNLATRWTSTSSAGAHWLRLDLGHAVKITGYKVWHASSAGGSTLQNTKAFEIQSSTSANGPWTAEFTGENAAQAPSNSFTYTVPKSLRHIRLWITNPGSDTVARINEFEVIAEPTMTAAVPTGTNIAGQAANVQASSVFSPEYGPTRAIDGVVSVTSKWTSSNVVPPHWLMLDLGTVRTISGFVLRQPSSAGEISQFNATRFSFQSARSASGPWFTETQVATNGVAGSEGRRFIVPKELRYVRLFIEVPNSAPGDNYARVPEFEVIEFAGADAMFSAAPLAGTAPLAVQFTDASVGEVTSWSWNFGDGGESTQQHPLHTYLVPGRYTASLTVTGPSGQDTETKPDYIDVLAASTDFDADGDVDQSDFGHFQSCYSGSGIAQALPDCRNARLDDDDDVDQDDFAIFAACMNGAHQPPAPNCGARESASVTESFRDTEFIGHP